MVALKSSADEIHALPPPVEACGNRSDTLEEAIGIERQGGALLKGELVALAVSVWVDTKYQARRDLCLLRLGLAAAGD